MLVESMFTVSVTIDNTAWSVLVALSRINALVVIVSAVTSGNTAEPVTDNVFTVAFAMKALLFTCKKSTVISRARDILKKERVGRKCLSTQQILKMLTRGR
jgi:hypothetical protein